MTRLFPKSWVDIIFQAISIVSLNTRIIKRIFILRNSSDNYFKYNKKIQLLIKRRQWEIWTIKYNKFHPIKKPFFSYKLIFDAANICTRRIYKIRGSNQLLEENLIPAAGHFRHDRDICRRKYILLHWNAVAGVVSNSLSLIAGGSMHLAIPAST